MKTKTNKGTFREWLSPEELHEESKKWMSELNFSKDEQAFLNDMVKDYTLDIIDSDMFNIVQPAIETLNKSEKEVEDMLKKVRLHENQLQIMVDEVNQNRMENAYLDTHADLEKELGRYFEKYREAKTKLFEIISQVIKRKKQKRLLN